MLDASALLWRLLLDGIDTGGRFGPLADAWAPKAAAAPWYVFNDLHATMAFVGAGRLAEAHGVIGRARPLARHRARHERPHDGRDRAARHAAPCVAFAEDRDADVIAELAPDPARARSTSAVRTPSATRCSARCSSRRCASGRFELAAGAHRRAARRARDSVYGWAQRARALRGLGDTTRAATADRAAETNRARFAAVERPAP